jgi:hypothetical protein
MDQNKRRHERIVMMMMFVLLEDIVVDPTKSKVWVNIPIRTIMGVVGMPPQTRNKQNTGHNRTWRILIELG